MAAHADMFADGEDDVIAAINIIPFVDIVLVLLIIFMVTSTVIIKASLKVDLPKAATAGTSVDSTLNIVLTRDDALFLNGTETTREALAASVAHEAAVNPKIQAVIAADKTSAYGAVIAVIDLVKQNGVSAFALNIEHDVKPTSQL